MKVSAAFLFLLLPLHATAQKHDERELARLNQAVDSAVVVKDLAFLQRHYADDFVFTHGTGHVDSKKSWLKNIRDMGDARFISRRHDSTAVELHDNVGIVTGTLSVQRESDDRIHEYRVRYVRVYARRQDIWQMISHRTTHQWP